VQVETSSRTMGEACLTVGIGRTVEIEWGGGGRDVYSIGAEGNSDPANHVIAADAPLARAIIGAKAGEARTYRAGHRVWMVRVLRVGGFAHGV